MPNNFDIQKIRGYLTRENIGFAIAVSGVMPLAFGVVGLIASIFAKVPVIGAVFGAVFFLMQIIAVLVSVGACAGAGYLIYKDDTLKSVSGLYALASAIISLITVLMIMGGNGLSFLFVIISAVVGLDIVSRVIIQDMDISSPVMFSQDMSIYKDYISKALSAMNEEKNYREFVAEAPNPSFFDGKGLDFLGYYLVSVLVSALTFSIASPWMICRNIRWRKEHTVINGRRLTFTGTGGQLIGLWIKWVLLSLITLGIYALFAYVDFFRWETKHTFFADENPQQGAENANAVFDGNTLQFVGYSLLCGLISTFTLGIGFAWGYTMLTRWQMDHTVISGCRMTFNGRGLQYLIEAFVIALLTFVTLGFYIPWAVCRLNRWTYSHVHYISSTYQGAL